MSDRPSTKIISIHVSDPSYDMLRELAAMSAGARMTDFAAEVFEHGLETYAKDKSNDSPETRLYVAYRVARKIERQRKTLEYLAIQYQKDPNESNRDALESLCKEVGFELDDIVEDITAQSSVVPLVDARSEENIEIVVGWIRKLMKSGKTLLSESCKDEGTKQGFSRRAILTAMQRCGVESRKGAGGKYYWLSCDKIKS